MRTLSHIPKPEKRQRIAQETMDLYAPLAGRIGMHELREELEDLAFREINPDARDSIVKRQDFLTAESGGRVQRITDEIKRVLTQNNVEAWVRGRQKRPFSIWRKMQEKSISFEQLSDVMGFRVVTGSVADCYKALGVLHMTWRTVPGRFKDYISLKKPNGYQSLHTTIVGPDNARIEVQIRTVQMNDIAERGVAAHWRYKNQSYGYDAEAAQRSGERRVGALYRRTRRDTAGSAVQRAEVRFDIAGCLRTPGGGSSRQTLLVVEAGQVRSRLMSARETARLMGLPDTYQLPGSYSAACHLTGDGVAVPVVRYLAQWLIEPLLAAPAGLRKAA
jgi:(p)ppGpp synthase/HD superfamily hydrolase